MNELKIFEHPVFGKIRTLEIDGDPWFVGKDVATALRYADTKSAISDHVDAEDKRIIQRGQFATFEIPNRGMTIINESGLYSLIMASKLPDAKKFKHWVTHDILPSIRKTGFYQVNPQPQSLQALEIAARQADAQLLAAKNQAVHLLTALWDRVGVKPEYQSLALSNFYTEQGVNLPGIALQGTKITYDKGTIAAKLGVYSKASGGKRPHATAIGAIISTLDIRPDEQEAIPYCRNGHDGIDYQYTDSVIDKAHDYLSLHSWPTPLMVQGRKYEIVYKKENRV